MNGIRKSGAYLIQRHCMWFRPDAQGYTQELHDAGVFSGDVAEQYRDLEGVRIIPLSDAKIAIAYQIRNTQAAVDRLQKMLEATDK